MARNKVDLCFLCGEAPCQCNVAPKKKQAKPAVTKVEPVSAPTTVRPKRSFVDAMSSAASNSADQSINMPAPATVPPVPHKVVVPVVNEEELLFNSAIRALEPLLSDEDRERYRVILSRGATQDEQKAAWKARRRAAQVPLERA